MLALLGALACVVANGFFVAAEFALAKVRPTQLEARIKETNDPALKRALTIVQSIDAYLPATQLGITLASLGLGWLGEPAIAALLSPALAWMGLGHDLIEGISVAVGFALMSSLHIVIGELVPKSLAIRKPEDIARLSSGPLRVFYLAVYPALILLNSSSKLVLRALGLPAPDHAEGKLSLEELHLLIQASFDENLEATKRDLLERVLRATDRPVRAIMVPRIDMEILSLADDFETWMTRVRRSGFSRYPVSSDRDPDHVVGYVYLKDLILHDRARAAPATLKRDILIVPESRTVGEILDEFQRTKIPIALVVDEYGGTSGLVTIDDALAEIVGEMQDEMKGSGQPKITEAEDGAYVIDGALPLDDLQLDGFEMHDHDNAATVGGYVTEALGRLPAPGDRLEAGKWEIVVEDVRARRVHRVRAVPREADGDAGAEA